MLAVLAVLFAGRTNGNLSCSTKDTDALPGTDHPQQHLSCGPGQRGLSIGWADTCEGQLPDKFVKIPDLPDDFYALRSTNEHEATLVEKSRG